MIFSPLIAGQVGAQRPGVSCQLILALMRPFLTAVKLEPTAACSRVNIMIGRLVSRWAGAPPPCNVSRAAPGATARPQTDRPVMSPLCLRLSVGVPTSGSPVRKPQCWPEAGGWVAATQRQTVLNLMNHGAKTPNEVVLNHSHPKHASHNWLSEAETHFRFISLRKMMHSHLKSTCTENPPFVMSQMVSVPLGSLFPPKLLGSFLYVDFTTKTEISVWNEQWIYLFLFLFQFATSEQYQMKKTLVRSSKLLTLLSMLQSVQVRKCKKRNRYILEIQNKE